jgi:hypothetical protein
MDPNKEEKKLKLNLETKTEPGIKLFFSLEKHFLSVDIRRLLYDSDRRKQYTA